MHAFINIYHQVRTAPDVLMVLAQRGRAKVRWQVEGVVGRAKAAHYL